LCIYEIENIILDTTLYWTFHRSEHQGMAKKHLAKVKITKNKSIENCKFVQIGA
jgi:hypothetical protein